MYTEVEHKREEIDNEVAASAAEPSMAIRALLKMRSLYIIALLFRANSGYSRPKCATDKRLCEKTAPTDHGYPS
jgi:hypothetical protein